MSAAQWFCQCLPFWSGLAGVIATLICPMGRGPLPAGKALRDSTPGAFLSVWQDCASLEQCRHVATLMTCSLEGVILHTGRLWCCFLHLGSPWSGALVWDHLGLMFPISLGCFRVQLICLCLGILSFEWVDELLSNVLDLNIWIQAKTNFYIVVLEDWVILLRLETIFIDLPLDGCFILPPMFHLAWKLRLVLVWINWLGQLIAFALSFHWLLPLCLLWSTLRRWFGFFLTANSSNVREVLLRLDPFESGFHIRRSLVRLNFQVITLDMLDGQHARLHGCVLLHGVQVAKHGIGLSIKRCVALGYHFVEISVQVSWEVSWLVSGVVFVHGLPGWSRSV